jgi:hypothetical protein
MSRPRRVISANGYLRCTGCLEVKHISDFWMQRAGVIWHVCADGSMWGKPQSRCKDCTRAAASTLPTRNLDTGEDLDREARLKGRFTEDEAALADDTPWVTEAELALLNNPRTEPYGDVKDPT